MGEDEFDIAIVRFHKALKILEFHQGPDTLEAGAIHDGLGRAYQQIKKKGEARKHFRRVLEILPEDSPHYGTALNNMAGSLSDLMKDKEAMKLYRKALAFEEARLGPEHPEVLQVLYNLASCLFDLKRLDEAEEKYRRALTIAEGHFDSEHWQVYRAQTGLERVLAKKKEPKQKRKRRRK